MLSPTPLRTILYLSGALTLTACGDGSDSATTPSPDNRTLTQVAIDEMCTEITGGDTVVKAGSEDCADCDAAADGAIASATNLKHGSLSVTAQPGLVFPAGSHAAVVISGDQPAKLAVSTSLQGELKNTTCVIFTPTGDLGLGTVGVDTTDSFDSIDVTIVPSESDSCNSLPTVTGDTIDPAPVSINVHEFCAEFASL